MPQVSLSDLITGVSSGQFLISFPTDTLPALAARPDRADLIFTTKQRSLDKPLILMVATVAEIWQYVLGSTTEQEIWQQVADRYLPGALTLVLPANDRVPPVMNPQDPSNIGIRVPDHPIAQIILAQTGALATTSANLSGQPALQTMAEIIATFPQVLTLDTNAATSYATHNRADTISAGSASGIASTVAKWTGNGWEILRQGLVKLTD